MIMMAKWYPGKMWSKFPDIRLTVQGKSRKNKPSRCVVNSPFPDDIIMTSKHILLQRCTLHYLRKLEVRGKSNPFKCVFDPEQYDLATVADS